MIIPVGTQHSATDLFNTMNQDIITALGGATHSITVDGTNVSVFDAFVDAQAYLGVEAVDAGAPATFALVHPNDMAYIRKALADSLKYVEAFARSGYVGSVAGTNLYVSNACTENTVNFATREAATLFVKTGTEVESERDANTRFNKVFARKYYLAALTNDTKAAKIVLPAGI